MLPVLQPESQLIVSPQLVDQTLPSGLDMMRRLAPAQGVAFGLSLFLFTFMLLPTFLILLAVVVFVAYYYPRLRKVH